MTDLPMPPPPTSFRILPALLLSAGIGLCGYYGQKWYELPAYTAQDMAASVELNLQIDLQRRGPHLQPDAEGLRHMREIVKTEVEANIRQEREKVQLRFGVGLIALVLGAGQLLATRLLT